MNGNEIKRAFPSAIEVLQMKRKKIISSTNKVFVLASNFRPNLLNYCSRFASVFLHLLFSHSFVFVLFTLSLSLKCLHCFQHVYFFAIYVVAAMCLPFMWCVLSTEKVIIDTRGVIVRSSCSSIKRLETHTRSHMNIMSMSYYLKTFIYSAVDYHFKQTIDNENNNLSSFMSNKC